MFCEATMRVILFICSLVVFVGCKSRQAQTQGMWTERKVPVAESEISPTRFKTFELDEDNMLQAIAAVGEREDLTFLTLPDPTGAEVEFHIWKSRVANPKLIEKYPNLQTYQGTARDNQAIRMRLERNDDGIQAMIIDSDGTWYISPVVGVSAAYTVYYKRDLPADAKNFWSDKIIKEF